MHVSQTKLEKWKLYTDDPVRFELLNCRDYCVYIWDLWYVNDREDLIFHTVFYFLGQLYVVVASCGYSLSRPVVALNAQSGSWY